MELIETQKYYYPESIVHWIKCDNGIYGLRDDGELLDCDGLVLNSDDYVGIIEKINRFFTTGG